MAKRVPSSDGPVWHWIGYWGLHRLDRFLIGGGIFGVALSWTSAYVPELTRPTPHQEFMHNLTVYGYAAAAAVIATMAYSVLIGYREQRNLALIERQAARDDLARTADLTAIVPAELSALPPVPYDGFVHFRLCVRNAGDRKAGYRAQVAELTGVASRSTEARFDLFWRHGDSKRVVEIAPEDDEVWLEFATVTTLDAYGARTIEVERWRPTVTFRILVQEGQDYRESTALFDGVGSADDLAVCSVRARVIIRHDESGKVAAEGWFRLFYIEEDGQFRPHMEMEEIGVSESL